MPHVRTPTFTSRAKGRDVIDCNRQTALFRQLHQWFHANGRRDPMMLPVYPGEDPERIAKLLRGLGYGVRINGKQQNLFCAFEEAKEALMAGRVANCTIEVTAPERSTYIL